MNGLKEMDSECIAQARAMVQQLYKRNQKTWNELDREIVFSINALIQAYINKKDEPSTLSRDSR